MRTTDIATDHRLLRALRRARRAWWRRAIGTAAWIGGVAALSAVVLAWPLRWRLGFEGWIAAGPIPSIAAATALAFALAFTVALLGHAFRAPSLLELARRCDRRLGLHQRMSTAFEVLAQPEGSRTTIAVRLLTDVRARLDRTDLSAAVRGPAPARLVRTFAVAAVAAGLALAVPVPALPEPGTADAVAPSPGSEPVMSPDDLAQLRDAAERIAGFLADEPQTERDPYLQAVAAGFGELAQALGEERVSASEAEAWAEELLEHLESAAQRRGGAVEEVVRDAMEPMAGGREGSAEAASEAAEGSPAGPSPPGSVPMGQEPAAGASGASAAEGQGGPGDDFSVAGMRADQLADALEQRAAERQAEAARMGNAASGFDELDPYGDGVFTSDDEDAAPPSDPVQRVQGEAGGQAVDAAQESSDRAGDAAGGGSAELGGEELPLPDLDAAADPVELPWSEREDGRRIEVETVPEAAEPIDEGDLGVPDRRAFDPAEEAAATGHPIGWAHQDVVARYFLPDSAEEPAGP
jgi:hypothetical protein